MPTVSLPAAPLNGGVSTQPPANRFETQTETSDNTMLYINRGLEKRYGSTYVSDIDYTEAVAGSTTHWVRRSKSDKYLIVINKENSSGNVVQVFGVDGAKKTVTISAAAEAYIREGTSDTKNSIVTTTYSDTTFILNQDVVTALTGAAPGYTIAATVSELVIPPDGGIAGQVAGTYVNLSSSDVGYPVGIYQVNDPITDAGPWYTRVKSDATNSSIDATTMPMRLVYDPATDTLDCDVAPWNDRLSGNGDLNPGPSFIGQTLSSLTLFQDRLWFAGGQQVVSSQAGDLYNFWIDDWTTTVDSDPIDITLSGSSVASAAYMIPFSRTLVVMADGSQQWELQALSSFTPADTNLVDTTTYTVSNECVPVKIANQLYFVSEQGTYSFLWEYFPNFDRDANIGQNVAKHVEEYIPSNITRLSASENNNLVFAWSEDQKNVLYLYMTSWEINQKVQSAWCRWVLDDELSIFSFQAFDNTLHVILQDHADNLWLETIPITPPGPTSDGSITDTALYGITAEDDDLLTTESESVLVLDQGEGSGIGYHAFMDRKVIKTGTYSSATKTTTFTLDFLDPNMDTVLLGDRWEDRKGQKVAATTSSAGGVTTLAVSGDFSTYPCIIGKSYTMSVELSPPFVKNEQGIPIMGSLSIKTLDILFEDSISFDVTVTPRGREPKIRRFSSSRYGSAVFGTQSIQDFGKFNVKVRGDSTDTSIVLSNSTPFPSLFTNLEYLCGFVRSRNNPTKR